MAGGQLFAEDVAEGDELPALRTTFTTRDLVMFAGAAADFYEIHYDRDFAVERGLGGLLVHGALKNTLLGRFLHEWVAPAGRIISYGCSYRGTDAPGEELVCRGHRHRCVPPSGWHEGDRPRYPRGEGRRNRDDARSRSGRTSWPFVTAGGGILVVSGRASMSDGTGGSISTNRLNREVPGGAHRGQGAVR